jgi:serine/threonine protein kinase
MGTDSWDQFSLAVTYYKLRTGEYPFRTREHLVEGSPDLHELDGAERKVVKKALAKKPDKRWRSCEHFVRELESAAALDGQVRARRTEDARLREQEKQTILRSWPVRSTL